MKCDPCEAAPLTPPLLWKGSPLLLSLPQLLLGTQLNRPKGLGQQLLSHPQCVSHVASEVAHSHQVGCAHTLGSTRARTCSGHAVLAVLRIERPRSGRRLACSYVHVDVPHGPVAAVPLTKTRRFGARRVEGSRPGFHPSDEEAWCVV